MGRVDLASAHSIPSGKPMDTIQLKQLKVKIRELQRLLKEEDTNIIQDANKGVSLVVLYQSTMFFI